MVCFETDLLLALSPNPNYYISVVGPNLRSLFAYVHGLLLNQFKILLYQIMKKNFDLAFG